MSISFGNRLARALQGPLFFAAAFLATEARPIFAAPVVESPPPLDAIIRYEGALPPVAHGAALSLPFAFSGGVERAYWDLPVTSRIDKDAVVLEIGLSCPSNAAAVRGLTLHLQSGDGWYSVQPAFSSRMTNLSIPLSNFQKEGSPGSLHRATCLRVSVWRRLDGNGALLFRGASARGPAPVAVIRATETTAPGETWLAGTMADRCVRLLSAAGIPHDEISDDFTASSLRKRTLVFLPFSPKLPARQESALVSYLESEGHRLVVFFNANARLGREMGVTPGPWRGGDTWSSMALQPPFRDGVRIPHVTSGIIPPHPIFGRKDLQLAATWVDGTGRGTYLPACVVSEKGAWFAHVPPRAYPAAVEMICDIVGDSAPPRPAARKPATPPSPAKGELRGAWLSSATSRDRRGWASLLPRLDDGGITDLFVLWQSAATPKYIDRPYDRDSIKSALAASAETGVRLHAWVSTLSLDGASPALVQRITANRGLLAGASSHWIDPEKDENRKLLVESLVALAKRGVHGVHLDYIRLPEGVPVTPERTAAITEIVRNASLAVREAVPGIVFSAAVFPTPEGAALHGQDWPAWVREGLVDFVCPMIYEDDPEAFRGGLAACLAAAPASALVPGIGTGADECQIDAATAADEITATRNASCRGFAFYAVDDALLADVLPALDIE